MKAKFTYLTAATYLIEVGSFRFLTDPGFDPEGTEKSEGPGHVLRKNMGPPIPVEDVGRIDAVFLSHAHHFDNLDNTGKAWLSKWGRVITHPDAAALLGGNAEGLATWEATEITNEQGETVTVTMPPGGIFDSWTAETSRYHSPDWWRKHLEASEIGDILECVELDDGPAMWEDKLAYDLEKSGFDDEIVESSRWKIDQILYGRNHAPRFTFFVASVNKF